MANKMLCVLPAEKEQVRKSVEKMRITIPRLVDQVRAGLDKSNPMYEVMDANFREGLQKSLSTLDETLKKIAEIPTCSQPEGTLSLQRLTKGTSFTVYPVVKALNVERPWLFQKGNPVAECVKRNTHAGMTQSEIQYTARLCAQTNGEYGSKK